MSLLSKNPEILKDFNLFVNGLGNLGKSKEVKLPTLKFKTVEVDNGGMAGPIDIPINLDKLEAEMHFSDFDPAKMGLVGLFHNQGQIYGFRGSIKDGSVEVPLVAEIGGSVVEVEPDTKKGEEIKNSYKISVTFYRLTKAGVQIFLIDKPNDIVMIGTTDINAVTRANIGA